MAEEKEPIIDKCATAATTKRCTVRLCDFELEPEKWCLRGGEELSKESLQLMRDSLVLEKQQQPVTVFRRADGKMVLLCGYRRVTSLRQLADDNMAGFTHDMDVEAIEVLAATEQDHTVISIASNETAIKLSRFGRLRGGTRR